MRKRRVFVDGVEVRAEAVGSDVYLVMRNPKGGTWRIAVRMQDIRRVLRGQPYDETTAAIAAGLLHGRWVCLSSMVSPSKTEARARRREQQMKVTISWVLKKDLANLESGGEDAREVGEWDAWSITKDISALADEEGTEYFSEVSEVSKDQVVVKPKGAAQGWSKQSQKASDKDDRLQQALDVLRARPYVNKFIKVQFGS